jgi:hypothetical protein
MTSTVVNSKTCEISEPGASLLAFLQSDLGLTRVKPGCGDGACGACTVLMNDVPVLACQIRAGDADLTGYLRAHPVDGRAGSGPSAQKPGTQRPRWPQPRRRCGPPTRPPTSPMSRWRHERASQNGTAGG